MKHAKNIMSLQKRLKRFLSSKKFSRGEVCSVIENLTSFGEVAIFGGMVRDICLNGNASFCSDVDLVVKLNTEYKLEQILSDYHYKINKFGGYRIYLNKWRVDIWELQNTWAFKKNLVLEDGLGSLLETTFFNWDSVVYEVNSGKIFCYDNYLNDIASKYLNINLKENPNRLGTTVRALRMLVFHNAKLSNKLAKYVLDNSLDYGEHAILDYEKKSFPKTYLSISILQQIINSITWYLSNSPSDYFELPDNQLHLSLE